MYPTLLRDEKFQALLLRCDRDLAEGVREVGCPHCSGPLHQANYARKVRGEEPECCHALRLSFCCGVEGCRKRTMPGSVRFFGRKLYQGLAFVLAGAAGQKGSGLSRAQVQKLLGVSRRTLQRWRRWWRETFARSRFWQGARGHLERPIEPIDLPQVLFDRFAVDRPERALALLRFLSPLTTTAAAERPAF